MTDYQVHATKPLTGARVEIMPPLSDLPPELVTGHAHLDAEHRLLLSCIANLRRVCSEHVTSQHCGACPAARRQHCESHLVGMLGDLLSFVLEHFRTEEAIMRDSLLLLIDREVCEAHMEDHAAISGKVQEIVAALDPMHTVVLIRQLDTLLSRWVSNHIALHDMLLVRWVQREDSVLRKAGLPPA